MKRCKNILLILILGYLSGCSNTPNLDSIIPANSSPLTQPSEPSTIGISIDMDLADLNKELQQYVGSSFEHRTGFSVKVKLHKVILNKAEEAAIKTWHETKAVASEARRRSGVLACNRKIRSSSRRECRDERNRRHNERMAGYNATKSRRIAANRRDEVKGFEVTPSSGNKRYVIASARLDKIQVSSLQDQLSIATKIHCRIKANIENPFDHSKEFKSVVNKDFDINTKITGNIKFTKEGKIELINKTILFSPRFHMSGVLKPLSGLAEKMNKNIEGQLKNQIDKQLAKFDFKKIVDKELLKLTKLVNDKTSKEKVWILPNFKKINLRTDKRFSTNPKVVGINVGLNFRPEIIFSENEPAAIKDINYDINLTNNKSPNQLSITSSVLVHLSDVSPIFTRKLQDELNTWLSGKNKVKKFIAKKFSIDKVDLISSDGNLLIVVYTKNPVSGTIVISAKPILKENGRKLSLTNVVLYSGTKSVLTEQTAWLLDIPLDEILKDRLSIDLKKQSDKAFKKIEEGVPLGKIGTGFLDSPSFSLKRLNIKNGNLLLELNLESKLEIIPPS